MLYPLKSYVYGRICWPCPPRNRKLCAIRVWVPTLVLIGHLESPGFYLQCSFTNSATPSCVKGKCSCFWNGRICQNRQPVRKFTNSIYLPAFLMPAISILNTVCIDDIPQTDYMKLYLLFLLLLFFRRHGPALLCLLTVSQHRFLSILFDQWSSTGFIKASSFGDPDYKESCTQPRAYMHFSVYSIHFS